MIKRTSVALSFLIATLIFTTSGIYAQRGDDSDRASKNGSTTGTIDGIEVNIEYGRPNVKGRQIWGALVPFDKVWRTGANEATTAEFSGDVAIGEATLPAGRYGIFTIPGEDEWTVIFNKQPDQWGATKYDAAEDALRVTVTPQSIEHVESMDFIIEDSSIVLRWEEIAVPIEVAAN
jgi:hypothetical protein